MAGLVADYGSESDVEDSDSSQPPDKLSGESCLPKPNFIGGSDDTMKCSVFVNPFVEADNAKNAILEKHVKMISTDVKIVNGKKICWNYRKNKCRFGHNCKYAHDSDLQIQIDKSIVSLSRSDMKQIDIENVRDVTNPEEHSRKRKKRPGLCQEVVPSKKVMKMYCEQKKKR